MLPFDHLIPRQPPPGTITVDDLIVSFLRGELDPHAELRGPAGQATVWSVLAQANERTADGWTVNRTEQTAASALWSIVEPGGRIRWMRGPYTLDGLRRMVAVGQAHAGTEVVLDQPGVTSIPLEWLLLLPVPQYQCPSPPSEHPVKTAGKILLGTAATVVTVLGAFKLMQAATDEDFGDGEFPAWFRRELIAEHVARFGWYCPACDSAVPRGSLTVDHIVAMRNGGRTSRANAQVLCRWCNSGKGAKNSPWDYVRGRAA